MKLQKLLFITGTTVLSSAGAITLPISVFNLEKEATENQLNNDFNSKKDITEEKLNPDFNLTTSKSNANRISIGWQRKGYNSQGFYRNTGGGYGLNGISGQSITTVAGNQHYFNFIQKKLEGPWDANANAETTAPTTFHILATPVDESSFKIIDFKTDFVSVSSSIFINGFLVILGKVALLPETLTTLGIYSIDSKNSTITEIINPSSPNAELYKTNIKPDASHFMSPIFSNDSSGIKEFIVAPIGITYGDLKTLGFSLLKISLKSDGTITKGFHNMAPPITAPTDNSIIVQMTVISTSIKDSDDYTLFTHYRPDNNTLTMSLVGEVTNSNFVASDHTLQHSTWNINPVNFNQTIPYSNVTMDDKGNYQLFWIFQREFNTANSDGAIFTQTFNPKSATPLKLQTIRLDKQGTLNWTTPLRISQIHYSTDGGDFNDPENPLLITIKFSGGPVNDVPKMGLIRWYQSDEPTIWNTNSIQDSSILSRFDDSQQNMYESQMGVVLDGTANIMGVLQGTQVTRRKTDDTFGSASIWTNDLPNSKIVLEEGKDLSIQPQNLGADPIFLEYVINYYTDMRTDWAAGGGGSSEDKFKKYDSNGSEINPADTETPVSKYETNMYTTGGYVSGHYNIFLDRDYAVKILKNPISNETIDDVSKLPFLINVDNPNFKLNPITIQNNLNLFNDFNDFKHVQNIIGFESTNMIQINEALLYSLTEVNSNVDSFNGTINLRMTFTDPNNNIFVKEILLEGFQNQLYLIPSIIVPIVLVIIIMIIVSSILVYKNKKKELLASKLGFSLGRKGIQKEIKISSIMIDPRSKVMNERTSTAGGPPQQGPPRQGPPRQGLPPRQQSGIK